MFDPWVVLPNLSDPVTLLLMTLSACFGIIMGAVPGLSGTLGIALLLPFTFGLESATALLMLGSVYCGSEYGGSIPSILINPPGTAAALCTTFDGYPMAMKGQAQKALFTALISSVFGGIFGVSALLFLSVPLANVSMKFGAPEQFWLCVFALTIIASLSSGNVLKGVIGALIGLVLACGHGPGHRVSPLYLQYHGTHGRDQRGPGAHRAVRHPSGPVAPAPRWGKGRHGSL